MAAQRTVFIPPTIIQSPVLRSAQMNSPSGDSSSNVSLASARRSVLARKVSTKGTDGSHRRRIRSAAQQDEELFPPIRIKPAPHGTAVLRSVRLPRLLFCQRLYSKCCSLLLCLPESPHCTYAVQRHLPIALQVLLPWTRGTRDHALITINMLCDHYCP